MSTSNKHHRYGMLSTVRTTSTHCRLILGHTSAKTELHRIRGSRHHEQKRCGSGLESYRRRKSGIPSVPTIADTYRADTNRLIMECHEGAVPSHNKTTALVGVAMREHNPGRVSTLSQKATELTTVQVSRPKRKAEVVRQNSHSSPHPEHN